MKMKSLQNEFRSMN